eukprot:3827221-Alexandrium_andersonii.AAC.1
MLGAAFRTPSGPQHLCAGAARAPSGTVARSSSPERLQAVRLSAAYASNACRPGWPRVRAQFNTRKLAPGLSRAYRAARVRGSRASGFTARCIRAACIRVPRGGTTSSEMHRAYRAACVR